VKVLTLPPFFPFLFRSEGELFSLPRHVPRGPPFSFVFLFHLFLPLSVWSTGSVHSSSLLVTFYANNKQFFPPISLRYSPLSGISRFFRGGCLSSLALRGSSLNLISFSLASILFGVFSGFLFFRKNNFPKFCRPPPPRLSLLGRKCLFPYQQGERTFPSSFFSRKTFCSFLCSFFPRSSPAIPYFLLTLPLVRSSPLPKVLRKNPPPPLRSLAFSFPLARKPPPRNLVLFKWARLLSFFSTHGWPFLLSSFLAHPPQFPLVLFFS